MGCPWSYPVLKSRCSIPATVMDVLSKMCGLLTFKVSRKPSSFHARNFVLCYQQNAMPSKSLNNVRPPSTLSAGACRAQSPLEGEPLPRRMKPDASPFEHDDIPLRPCARKAKEEKVLRLILIDAFSETGRDSHGEWTPTATPRPRMSRAI